MEKIKNFFWPYDEVQISKNDEGIQFKAPWVNVNFPLNIEAQAFGQFESIRKNGPRSATDIHLVDSLLRPVAKYPLYFCLPNHNKKPDSHFRTKQPNSQINSIRWENEHVLNFSATPTKAYDAVSALSCFRLLHLKDLMDYLETIPRDLKLPFLEGKKLREATLLFLRQNHFVTQKCENVLTPAQNLHPDSSVKIKEFIREEQGHDKLLELSFKELGVTAETIYVLPTLVKLMNLFEQVASINLLAFCFIVDIFERSPEAHKNPMVQALLKLGEDKAAKPIQTHANINVNGGHSNESFKILDPVGLLPQWYIQEGLYWAQQASDAMIDFLKERNQFLEKIRNQI